MLWVPQENGLKRSECGKGSLYRPVRSASVFSAAKAMMWVYFLHDQYLLRLTFQQMLHESHRPPTAYLIVELPGTLGQQHLRSWAMSVN